MFWDDDRKLKKALREAKKARLFRIGREITERVRERDLAIDREAKRMVIVREKTDAIFLAHGWMHDWRGWLIKVVGGVIFRVEYRDDLVVIKAKKEGHFKTILKDKIEAVKVVNGGIEISGRRIG